MLNQNPENVENALALKVDDLICEFHFVSEEYKMKIRNPSNHVDHGARHPRIEQ